MRAGPVAAPSVSSFGVTHRAADGLPNARKGARTRSPSAMSPHQQAITTVAGIPSGVVTMPA